VVWVDYDGRRGDAPGACRRSEGAAFRAHRDHAASTTSAFPTVASTCRSSSFDGIVEPWLMRSAAVVYILPEGQGPARRLRLRGAGAVAPTAQQMRTIPAGCRALPEFFRRRSDLP
jgi:hypothetical protein